MFKKILVMALTLSLVYSTVPQINSLAATNVTVDPSIRYQTMDGWGTCLSWWATQVGGWNDAARNDIIKKLFNPVEGIGLNIVKYNIGGDDDPSCQYNDEPGVTHMRPEAKIQSYINPDGTYNWNADANQRWVLQAAKTAGVNMFEAFSVSPPYWMTKSGCSAGAVDGGNNLQDNKYNAFADYLSEVVEHFRDYWEITFTTISPMNESGSWWWKAGGSQEGCHFDNDKQNTLVKALGSSLAAKGLTSTKVTAPDEFDVGSSRNQYNNLDSTAKSYVSTIGTHAYGADDTKRYALRDLALSVNKPIWQTEVCHGGTEPHSHTAMSPALQVADQVMADVGKMGARAWFIWQAVENEYYNTNGEYNYGLIHGWYYGDDAQTYNAAKQYYAMGQFSKFIREGDTIIDANNPNVLAAVNSSENKLVLVAKNNGTAGESFTFDLSKFTGINGGKATPYRTSETQSLSQLSDLTITNKTFSDTLPAKSITTYVIYGANYMGPLMTVVNDNVTGTGNFQYDYNKTWGYGNSQAGAYSNDNHWSGDTNDFYNVDFVGTQVRVYGSKAYNHGIAAVSIDGGAETNIDCYSASRQDQVLLYTSPVLPKGQHTVKVRVTGTKNASSSGYYVPADKIVAVDAEPTITYGETVNDNTTGSGDNQFEYNITWSYYASQGGAYLSDNHYSAAANSYYQVRFKGSQVKIYGAKASNEGIAAISIDGGAETLVDCYSSTRQDQVLLYTSPVLSNGSHIVKVRVTGTKNPDSSGYIIPADRVDVIRTCTIVNDQSAGTGANKYNYNAAWGYYAAQQGAYCEDNHWSGTTNDNYQVSFTGTQVRVYGAKVNNMGKAAISIDSGAEVIVDCYAATRQDQALLYASPVLIAGQHTVKVRVTGTKNSSSAGVYIPADKIEIIN